MMPVCSMLFISGNKPEISALAECILSVCPEIAVNSVYSGKEAFFLLQKSKKDNSPSAIVIDYMLPDITGLEFFRIVRDSSKYKDIPVLIMSGTYTEPADRAAALFAGASGFIQKPDFSYLAKSKENARKWGESFCRELSYQLKIDYEDLCGFSSKDKEFKNKNLISASYSKHSRRKK